MPLSLPYFSTPTCQPALSRAERRAAGVYYTPPEIVELIVELTLDQLKTSQRPPRILDPACGAGEFALQAFRRLWAQFGGEAARRSIFAVDVDSQAVATTRRRLREIDNGFPEANVSVADTLCTDSLAPDSFDAILGNPPYINIRQLAKSLPRKHIERLKQRYTSARGNFDLYVLFIERAIELLQPEGRCGLIIPAKWATLDYARRCRELLLQKTTIERIVDLSDTKVFAEASVFPHVLVFRKRRAPVHHVIQFSSFSQDGIARTPQQSLTAAAIHLTPTLDVESRLKTQPLKEVAKLSCGTAGYVAERIAGRLREAKGPIRNDTEEADFITSGNIDRYAIRLGNVRYMSHSYARPRLPLEIPELTAAKRRLFSSPKIVVAGMSRRLEAAWDDRGLALGVQVFAVSECQLDPFYLLPLLNSKLLSYLFATRYAAKRLGGGYLAINKGQLARLPVAMPDAGDRRGQCPSRLAKLAGVWQAGLDGEMDRQVYELYELTDAEIDRVEAHFALQPARAA
jgi:methylase of polypeptide subunit release factors